MCCLCWKSVADFTSSHFIFVARQRWERANAHTNLSAARHNNRYTACCAVFTTTTTSARLSFIFTSPPTTCCCSIIVLHFAVCICQFCSLALLLFVWGEGENLFTVLKGLTIVELSTMDDDRVCCCGCCCNCVCLLLLLLLPCVLCCAVCVNGLQCN